MPTLGRFDEPCEHARHGCVTDPAAPAGLGPCPAHFAELAERAMLGYRRGPLRFAATVNHLVAHRWMGQALMTWTALAARYGLPPGVDRADVTAHVIHANPDAARFAAGWLPLYARILSGILDLDAAAVRAALAAGGRLPVVDRLNFTGTVARLSLDALESNPAARGEEVDLFLAYGSQVATHASWDVLADLVGATVALLRDDDAALDAAVGRIRSYDGDHLLAALATAARTLGGYLDPGGPVLLTRDGPLNGDGEVAGALNWRDPDAAGLSPLERAMCTAMRIAVAYGRGDPTTVTTIVRAADKPANLVFEATYGAVSLMAHTVVDLRRLADPPPGDPG